MKQYVCELTKEALLTILAAETSSGGDVRALVLYADGLGWCGTNVFGRSPLIVVPTSRSA